MILLQKIDDLYHMLNTMDIPNGEYEKISDIIYEIWNFIAENQEALEKLDKPSFKGISKNSQIYKAFLILREKGQPMKINDILREMGVVTSHKAFINLYNSLRKHADNDKIFTRSPGGIFDIKYNELR